MRDGATELPAGRIVGGKYTVCAALAVTFGVRRYDAITAPNREVVLDLLPRRVAEVPSALEALGDARERLVDVPAHLVLHAMDVGVDSDTGAPYVVAVAPGAAPVAELAQVCPLNGHELAGLARALAESLGAAHAAGVLHLALDPWRVHLGPLGMGTAVVGGFGLGAALAAAHAHEDAGRWGAPELAEGTGRLGPGADVYGMANVLLYAATGVSASELAAKKPDTTPSAFAAARGLELPAAVDAVLARALARDPGARPDSVHDLARDFEAAVLGQAPASAPAPRAPSRTMPLAERVALPAPDVARPVDAPPLPPSAPSPPPPPPPSAPLAYPMPPFHAPSPEPPSAPAIGGAPFEAAPYSLAPPAPSTRSSRAPMFMAIGAAALVLVAGVGFALLRTRTAAGTHEPGTAASAAHAANTARAASAANGPEGTVSPAPELAAPSSVPPATPAAAPAPSPAAEAARPAASPEAPQEAPRVVLGRNESELLVVCAPACDVVLANSKPLRGYPKPVKLRPGTYGIGVSRSGYGGQWKKVVLEGGSRKTVAFDLIPAPARAKGTGGTKPCGKFLKRCD